MNNIGNAMKAVCLVLGGLALIGVLVLLSPIIMAVGSAVVSIIAAFLPVVLVIVAIAIAYKYFQERS